MKCQHAHYNSILYDIFSLYLHFRFSSTFSPFLSEILELKHSCQNWSWSLSSSHVSFVYGELLQYLKYKKILKWDSQIKTLVSAHEFIIDKSLSLNKIGVRAFSCLSHLKHFVTTIYGIMRHSPTYIFRKQSEKHLIPLSRYLEISKQSSCVDNKCATFQNS